MKLPSIRLTREALSRFDVAIWKEWLVTNGLGGYAASTVLGINTRKYHGLLVAALHPPGDRTVCLAKLDEEACTSESSYPFGANEFHGALFPQGYQFLREFSVAPFPQYVYTVQDIEVTKTIFMPTGKNATAVIYRVLNGKDSDVKFKVYPLLNCRHFHSVVDRTRNPLSFSQQQNSREVQANFSNPKATIAVQATEGQFIEKPNWIDHVYYREEASRGESNTDDCYQPGYFQIPVAPKQKKEFAITATASESTEETKENLQALGATALDVKRLLEQELEQRGDLLLKFYGSHEKAPASDWLNWILLAAATFIVKGSGDSKSVIAGYFWFETWGRDTFISLPGLMLATGRFQDAKNILLYFQRYCRQGLIPNRVEDRYGEPSYNTVDATLWYVNAVLQYLKYTGDFKLIQKQLWESLKAIVDSHGKGTVFGIHVDSDGLLAHGPQLTWMDAEVDGTAVTPRAGKAVEIQALWYNTLRTMQLLAGRFEEKRLAENYADMATKARNSFNLEFWNTENNCLFDVVSANADASLRPNQIIAASLDFTMLDSAKNAMVVDAVQHELLTPCGLRTLARSNPRYRGAYQGDRRSRDQAYHNGTVWAWLLGPFTTAFLKAKGHSEYWRNYALKTLITPLFNEQVTQAGLGTVSEVFDGDSPHAPRGCIAQAWSVAEPLRAYMEDILQIRPSHEKEVLQT